MLSRVADSIYWMNRYIERAENVARVVDVNLYLTLDQAGEHAEQWEPVIATLGDAALFRAGYGDATRESVMRFLAFDASYPNSILSCLRAARENARSVREAISSEIWEQVNRAFLMVRDASNTTLDAPHEILNAVKLACHLFIGVTYMTMSHNEGWHFGRLGRLIERADKTSRIVDVKHFRLPPADAYAGSPHDEIHWAALLKSVSAFEMYRKRYGRIAPTHVLEFLVLDRQFPRSIRYCVRKAERSLHAITGTSLDARDNAADARLGALRLELDGMEIERVLARGVHEYLDDLQRALNAADDAVSATFFALEPSAAAAPAV
jgi:uncharacterized alpha-E superfamily protein